MIKLFKTWKEANDLFVKPKVKFSIYKNYYKPSIWIAKYQQYHYVKDSVTVKVGTKESILNGKSYNIDCYDTIRHKMPTNKSIVWNSSIRKKLRKYHLSWIPPIIYFPKWLYYGIKNWDVGWKWKFDDIRHECNPLFEVTLFGTCFCWSVCCPVNIPRITSDSNYWECILNYLYKNKDRKLTLAELFAEMGRWDSIGQKVLKYFTLRPEYLIPSKREEYYKVVKEFKKNHPNCQEYI